MFQDTPRLPDAVRKDFVPRDAYVFPSYVALEEKKLWPKVWLIAARLEEVEKPGDYVTFDIGQDSMLIVRQTDGSLRVFYNVCQHRGRRLKDNHSGKTGKIIRCAFHGWRYNLDGSVESILNRDDWKGCPNFTDDDLHLQEVRFDTWGGWIWVTMDPDIEPLIDYLEPAASLIAPYEIDKQRMAWYHSIVLPINWKTLVDAFNEAYHSCATHPTTFPHGWPSSWTQTWGKHGAFYQPLEPAEDRSEKVLPAVKQASMREKIQYKAQRLVDTAHSMVSPMMLRATKRLSELPEDADDMTVLTSVADFHREELRKEGIEFPKGLTPEMLSSGLTDVHIFPNTTLVPGVDSTLWLRMRPNGDRPDSCIWDIWSLERFGPGKAPGEPNGPPKVQRKFYPTPESYKGTTPFLEEDFQNMEATQKGMLSRGFRGGRTNPVQELTVSHFHRQLYEYYSVPDEV